MTGAELRTAQRAMNLTNAQLRRKLGVAETTLCNWKSGRIDVPTSVALAMKYLQEKHEQGK
jgi:DNA-binding transcriptional regulator YiaG